MNRRKKIGVIVAGAGGGAALAAALLVRAWRRMDGGARFQFVDGGHVTRDAVYEGSTLRILTKPPIEVQIDRHPSGEPGKAASGANVGVIAYALLALLRDVWRAPIGTRLGLSFGGRRLLAIFETHPADASKPFDHPGVGMRELAAAS